MSAHDVNRTTIPLDELKKYDGQWVAWSLDGRHILASAVTIPELEERLAAAGEDPERVAFEWIELEDSRIGGAEFL